MQAYVTICSPKWGILHDLYAYRVWDSCMLRLAVSVLKYRNIFPLKPTIPIDSKVYKISYVISLDWTCVISSE